MIIGQPSFNQLDTTLSILYLCMKYLLSDGRVGVIQSDQEISRTRYMENIKLKRFQTLGVNTRKVGSGIKLPKAALQGGARR